MDKSIRRFNKTFNIGEVFLNACVGNNGLQDLQTYGEGFDIATKTLIDAAKKDSSTIDATIYPLVFCARHRLELFLKDQLLKLLQIRKNYEITEKLLIKTHDLKVLWELFKKHGKKTDSRLINFINESEEVFLDFAEIDPNGETFRYPYSKFKALHLIETPIINIAIFEKSYTKLSEHLENIEYLTNYLIDEYKQGTYTKELSREDIENISIALPKRNEWVKDNFVNIQDKIKEEYRIGSRKLSKVLDIIQKHREFCVNIEMEIPLEHIDEKQFSKYIEIYNKLKKCNEKKTTGEELRKRMNKYIKVERECFNDLQANLFKDSIICIYTLIELGRDGYWGEAYDWLYEIYENEAKDEYLFNEKFQYILNNTRALELIKRGLSKSGQKTLLIKFFS